MPSTRTWCKPLFSLFLFFLFIGQSYGSCRENFLENAKELPIERAQFFQVYRHPKGTLLINKNPAPTINEKTYWVSKKDSPCAGWERVLPSAKKIIAMAGTHLSFLEMLGNLDAVVAVGASHYVYNSTIRKKTQNGEVKSLGHPPEVEKAIKTGAGLVLGFSAVGPQTELGKLSKGKFIPIVYISEFFEKGPLARVEWIKFFGALLGKYEKAENIYREIENRYQKVHKTIPQKAGPKVLLGSLRGGAWVAPSADSDIVQILKDAGGEYVFSSQSKEGPIRLSPEKVFQFKKDLDYWIPLTNDKKWATLVSKHHLHEKLPFLPHVKVYNNTARLNDEGANDYWESAVTRPDLLLQELAGLFWPKKRKRHKRWFELIHSGEK